MLRAVAECSHCGERKEIEGLDPSQVPMVCQKCGQVMILSTPEFVKGEKKEDAKPQPQVPSYSYQPYPATGYQPLYYPPVYPARPRARTDTPALVSIILYLTGVLGIIFWASFFLVGYGFGAMTLDIEEPESTMAFGFSIVMLISALFALLGGRAAKARNYEMALMGSIFGLVSFGYVIGSIFSFIALALVLSRPEDFSTQGNKEGPLGGKEQAR